MRRQSRLFACLSLLLVLAACMPAPAAPAAPGPIMLVTADPNATATPTPFQPALYTDTPPPTLTPPPTDVPTLAPTLAPPTAGPSSTVDPNAPAPGRTQYIFYATLDHAGHSLIAEQTIRYFNSTGRELTEIVMAVPPNLWGGAFFLNGISQDGTALSNYSLVGERMSVILPQPLASGAPTTFTLNFALSIPVKRSDGIFGWTGDQTNLTDWFPFIVPYENGAWLLHDPWAFGEHLVYDAADFELNLKVTDPSVMVAASAPAQANGEWTTYRIYAARTFALTASSSYLMSESAVGHVIIRTYYFPGYEGAGEGLLRAATSAVGLFNAKFGEYPYDSLSVVQTEVADGQEYDGLVFVGSKFYAEYGGSARSNLISIGVHEISHQWWFGLVGSDQALEPWLDEALAIYSENTFYYYNFPNYGDWWWNFRVNYFNPSGWVDSTIYDHGTFRSYVNAAYLNGANFLYDVNTRMGDDDFYRFLRDYASRYGHRRAAAGDFFAVLRENSSADVSDLIGAYFQRQY